MNVNIGYFSGVYVETRNPLFGFLEKTLELLMLRIKIGDECCKSTYDDFRNRFWERMSNEQRNLALEAFEKLTEPKFSFIIDRMLKTSWDDVVVQKEILLLIQKEL